MLGARGVSRSWHGHNSHEETLVSTIFLVLVLGEVVLPISPGYSTSWSQLAKCFRPLAAPRSPCLVFFWSQKENTSQWFFLYETPSKSKLKLKQVEGSIAFANPSPEVPPGHAICQATVQKLKGYLNTNPRQCKELRFWASDHEQAKKDNKHVRLFVFKEIRSGGNPRHLFCLHLPTQSNKSNWTFQVTALPLHLVYWCNGSARRKYHLRRSKTKLAWLTGRPGILNASWLWSFRRYWFDSYIDLVFFLFLLPQLLLFVWRGCGVSSFDIWPKEPSGVWWSCWNLQIFRAESRISEWCKSINRIGT